MAGIDAGVEAFLSTAGKAQAALLGAACLERASGILFWVVSRDGRAEDLKVYDNALEFIWAAPLTPDLTPPSTSADIEGLQELVVGDEATMAAAFAFQPAIAMRAMLMFHESADISAVRDCLLTCANQAYFLGRRTGSDTLGAEEAALARDVSELSRAQSVTHVGARLRADARAVARDRLDAAVDRYGS
ncbi:hypothetical protein Caci_2337 [Catenulispora acidiphila DSM 44928]|uniref:Uncharacterized protein n=1 Tax=Catenulispora acidiphila (strain DSM 44928 / JCM 14897 / NBRC 102108 / NRRL B-24433 / ID139908) TaxID=479433 RepID=C7QJN2_CATAD|nr:hypothetical protein [Catenulispora acidiphila]ACU71255.1 hypothetical protein Caci_2337 [Catenulispora acidiphila DSM 44928]